MIRFRVLTCNIFVLLLPLILSGLVSPLSLKLIITRLFCLRFIISSLWNFDHVDWAGFSLATEISTPLSSFASVGAALKFFNGLILDATNNYSACFSFGWTYRRLLCGAESGRSLGVMRGTHLLS